MPNKTLLALAAIAALSSAAFVSTAASAAPQGHQGHQMRRIPGNWHQPHWHHQIVRYRVRTPVVYAVTRPVAVAPCTCLTKQYTPEGAVLFKDICTNEAAINPPPQQTGMLQVEPQPAPQQPAPQQPPQQ